MLKIRFQRTGRKNDPAFRIVVTEHTASPKAGKNVAQVGSYHPKTKHTIIDAEAVVEWIGKGAKASGTVHNLLVSKGIIEGKKINVLGKKTPIVKEGGVEEKPAAASSTEDVSAAANAEDALEKEIAEEPKEETTAEPLEEAKEAMAPNN